MIRVYRGSTNKRTVVHHMIDELAASGDPVGADLADLFASPEQLLGGDGDGH